MYPLWQRNRDLPPDSPPRKVTLHRYRECCQQVASSYQLLEGLPWLQSCFAQGHADPKVSEQGRSGNEQSLMQNTLMGTTYIPAACQVDPSFFRFVLLFILSLCTVLLPLPHIHEFWSSVSILYSTLHPSFCFKRAQRAIYLTEEFHQNNMPQRK